MKQRVCLKLRCWSRVSRLRVEVDLIIYPGEFTEFKPDKHTFFKGILGCLECTDVLFNEIMLFCQYLTLISLKTYLIHGQLDLRS